MSSKEKSKALLGSKDEKYSKKEKGIGKLFKILYPDDKYSRYINILLALIILSALILRLFHLNENPAALNQDEAMNGYNAFSLSKTLRDSRGFFLPSLMHGFGNIDFRSPLYAYLTVPVVWLMGLNDTSTRLMGLILNVALLLVVYLFTDKLFKNKTAALLSAFFLSITPWHFHYSRIGHEAVISPFFYFLFSYLLIKGLTCKDTKKSKKLIIISAVIMGIGMYSYQVSRILSPLLFGVICAIYYKESIKNLKPLIVSGAIAFIVVFPMIYSSVIAPGELESRFNDVSILGKPDIVKNFITNYFAHFSPKYLLFEGDTGNLPGMVKSGMFLFITLPLSLIGIVDLIYLFFKKNYQKEILIIFAFLFLYPLPSAITFPAPHSLRAYTLIPVISILSAFGVWGIISFAKSCVNNKLNSKNMQYITIPIITIILIPSLLSFGSFLNKYYNEYPEQLKDYYNYGFKESVNYIKENQQNYSKIYFTSNTVQPFVYILFYQQYDPQKYIDIKKDANYSYFGTINQFDKYYFVDDQHMPLQEKDALYITKVDNLNGKTLLKTITDKYGKPYFYIWN